ncbi:hypothetical protein Tco_0362266 [Tanacetum coccineum]
MITTTSRIKDKKPSGLLLPPQLKIVGILETFHWVKMHLASHRTLHYRVSDLQQGGSPNQEPQPTTSISDLSCLWGERALQKSVPKSKQQCPWESIHAEVQERSPWPERSYEYVPSKPTSS